MSVEKSAWVDSRRGGVLSGLLIAFLVLVAGCLAVAFYIARNVNIRAGHNGSQENVSIDTPVGHLNVRAHGKLNPAALGIPLYPEARSTNDSALVEWTSNDRYGENKDDKDVIVSAAEMVTDDPVEKVADFYRERLPRWMVTKKAGSVRFELIEGGYKRIVAIRQKADGTHIGVASTGGPAAN